MMDLTIRELSDASGVSIRALHFYEELGLLLPLYKGQGGVRHYGEEQVLQLQQIMLYKELGFSLKKIQKLMTGGPRNSLELLAQQRALIAQEHSRLENLLHSVDRTIQHLKEQQAMQPKDFFQGFSEVTIDPTNRAEAIVLSAIASHGANSHSPAQRQELLERIRPLYTELAKCQAAGLNSRSPAVQLIIARHFDLASSTQGRSLDAYSALAELYVSHPAFRAQLEVVSPTLPEFTAAAMQAFCLKADGS
jgi:DNA-binding transcriptional MerR regulator